MSKPSFSRKRKGKRVDPYPLGTKGRSKTSSTKRTGKGRPRKPVSEGKRYKPFSKYPRLPLDSGSLWSSQGGGTARVVDGFVIRKLAPTHVLHPDEAGWRREETYVINETYDGERIHSLTLDKAPTASRLLQDVLSRARDPWIVSTKSEEGRGSRVTAIRESKSFVKTMVDPGELSKEEQWARFDAEDKARTKQIGITFKRLRDGSTSYLLSSGKTFEIAKAKGLKFLDQLYGKDQTEVLGIEDEEY